MCSPKTNATCEPFCRPLPFIFSMKPFFSLSSFALLGAVALVGCGGNNAPENSATPSENAVSSATPEPTATPTNEDERYRATSAEDIQFPPEDKPETIALYKKYMNQVHQQRPPLDMKAPDKATVIMKTSRGPITLELDGKAAPLHVKSFLYLAGKGFYNGTAFHRHEDLSGGGQGFIVQGGDPLTAIPEAAGFAGKGGPGYETPRERNKLTHEKLIIAAARTPDPDSAGSQFYITQGPVLRLDEGDGYTVFGKVVAGKDVAMKLTKGDKLQGIKVEGAKTAPTKPSTP